MSTKTDRFADAIYAIASPIILDYIRENEESFGIVSVLEIEITKDRSYADIFVTSTTNDAGLPKFLAPLAHRIRHDIGQAIDTYKIPAIRFKRQKHNKEAEKSVYDLITELSNQYALREEN